MLALAFVPDGEAAVAEEPADRPLDPPAVSAESLAGLDAGAGDPRGDAPAAEPSAVSGGVVRLVGPELVGSAAARSAARPYRRYATDEGPERVSVVDVRAGDSQGQRQALCVGQDVQFAALLAPVDRIRPGQRSPFLARTFAASTMAEVQSISPRAPSSSRTARCSRRQTPALVQPVNRRWAVAGETPNVSGSIRHAHPLVSTYTTAANACLSSTGAVPPPCFRGGNSGSKGSTRTHRPSGTRRDERSRATDGIMPTPLRPRETASSPSLAPPPRGVHHPPHLRRASLSP
ncbi:hypothetical protein SAMN05421773_13027 [Streptomyces aidingensis]|uniref:Uncharacterized protein n=1 Tax=Streptomyces aidingensis TaxID=910347 RepID=A0A1I1V8M3_9ACTN|nr:hypothetical protein SAMN05421773_13027 [Streptomyces aidingensis]